MGRKFRGGKRNSHSRHREEALRPVRDQFHDLGRRLPVDANEVLTEFGMTRGDLLLGRYDPSELSLYQEMVEALTEAGFLAEDSIPLGKSRRRR